MYYTLVTTCKEVNEITIIILEIFLSSMRLNLSQLLPQEAIKDSNPLKESQRIF